VAGLAALSCTVGCARRTDAQTRAAFERGAGTEDDSGGPRTGSGRTGEDDAEQPAAPKQGWARVDDVLRRAAEILESTGDPDIFARLAQKWCAVEPEALETRHGLVRVCFPKPPVTVDGHAFSLELGAVGVIGLVASDLTAGDSRSLTDKALARTKSLCSSAFVKAAERERNSAFPDVRSTHEEIHTCETAGGSMLAVGRLPIARGVWQVSIAVVGVT
jgi:hypothetical protein